MKFENYYRDISKLLTFWRFWTITIRTQGSRSMTLVLNSLAEIWNFSMALIQAISFRSLLNNVILGFFGLPGFKCRDKYLWKYFKLQKVADWDFCTRSKAGEKIALKCQGMSDIIARLSFSQSQESNKKERTNSF